MIKVAIGIDVGGTNTVIGFVNNNGEILKEGSIKTSGHALFENYTSRISEKINELLADDFELIGIGIGAPNGNIHTGCIEHAPNLAWKGILPIVEHLQTTFDTKAKLTNDANAAALGEMLFGKAKDKKDFVVITLGTGLGSGIVSNGELVYGHDGMAGEIGHTTVFYDGRTCGCGRKGCLETYASATGIRTTVLEMLENSDKKSALREVPMASLESKHIYEAAIKNDEIALEAFEYTGRILGRKLADTVAHTSPEVFYFFGGLALAGDLIMLPTQRYFEEHLLKNYKGKIKMELSGLLSKNAAILGAAALIWNEDN